MSTDFLELSDSDNDKLRIDLILELVGEWRNQLEINNEAEINSSGNLLYLSPGVRLSKGAWSFSLSAGQTIVENLRGQQSEPELRLLSGLAFSF